MEDAPHSSPALAGMRQRTRSLHIALENTLRIASPAAGRAEYVRHIAAMWGWLQPLESRLWRQRWPAAIEAHRRGKGRWLRQDIDVARAAGFLDEPPPLCAHPHDFTQPAVRYGWAYVIEGSMLGGQVLHRQLAARLHPWPLRFLQGYGHEAGELWRGFLATLAEEVRTPAQVDAASEAAAAAFQSVGEWLRGQGAA